MLENYSDAGEMLSKILNEYDAFPNVTVKFIDPDMNPNIIREIDPDNLLGVKLEDLVVNCGNKSKKVIAQEMFYSDYNTGDRYVVVEQSVTGAIKYVTSEYTPVVYFVEGHGERSVNNEYLGLKQILENGNYIVQTLNLAVESKVPEDAEIVIFTGPKTDLSKAEADRLLEYFKNDGNCIFLFEPVNSDKKFENFEYVLNEYNISINYDRVRENDESRHYPNDPYTFLPKVETSEITGNEDLSQFFVLLNETRSFSILNNQKEPLNIIPLLSSSEKSIGESYGVSDEDDSMGPCLVGVAAHYNSAYNAKLLVYGNAYVISDKGFETLAPYSQNTMSFFLAGLSWMRDTTNDFVTAPKTNIYDVINLTSNSARRLIIITVLVVPFLIIGIGIFVWLRRRRL
jgi:ABC-2 type transport system permease protein